MITLEILVSFTLLLACSLWVAFRYVPAQDRWIYFLALPFKILVGWGLALMYDRYYQMHSADTFRIHTALVDFSRVIFLRPLDFFSIFWYSIPFESSFHVLEIVQSPRVCFFIKILFFINLVCFDNYWLLSAWLSFFSIVGSVVLVKSLLLYFPKEKLAAWLSFVCVPSFFFWTSGLLKESVMWTVICVLITIYLKIKRDWTKVSAIQWLAFVLLFWFLFGIKFYFFSALATAFIVGIIVPANLNFNNRMLVRLVAGLTALVIVMIGIGQVVPQLTFDNFLESLITNHDLTIKHSLGSKFEGSFIHFHELGPTWSSVIENVPLAIFSAIFRPFFWETNGILQVLVSIQGTIVSIFFMVKLFVVIKNRSVFERQDLLVSSLYFILITSSLLAIASPNFGALERYKSGFYPFFVFIVLYKNPLLEKLSQAFPQSIKKI